MVSFNFDTSISTLSSNAWLSGGFITETPADPLPLPEAALNGFSYTDDTAQPPTWQDLAGAIDQGAAEIMSAVAGDETLTKDLQELTSADGGLVHIDRAVSVLSRLSQNEGARLTIERHLTAVRVPQNTQDLELQKSLAAARRSRELLRTANIDEAMAVVRKHYAEMDLLAGKVNATPERPAMESGGVVSERIFNKKQGEFDRTALGIQSLLWVLRGEYDALTACQNPTIKLTKASFNELQKYTAAVLRSDPGFVDAMIVFMLAMDAMTAFTVVNDLGKVVTMVDHLAQKAGIESADHDKILFDLLRLHPNLSPSFDRLPEKYKTLIMKGLEAQFSLPQLMQAECLPADLARLKNVDSESLEFLLLHHIFDLAGAAGGGTQNGSVILKENTFRSAMAACAAVRSLKNGKSETEAYHELHRARAENLGLDYNVAEDRVVERASCMFDIFTAEEADIIKQAFTDSEKNTKEILRREMVMTGVDDGWAIMPYYAPGLLRNVMGTLNKKKVDRPLYEAAKICFQTLARAYRKVRIELKDRKGNGVSQMHLEDIAVLAGTHPQQLDTVDFIASQKGPDFIMATKAVPVIRTSALAQKTFADIPGNNILVVGIGGGSDGLQAVQLANLLAKNDKKIAGTVSVRKGPLSKVRIENHDGEIIPGVFKIKKETTGEIGTTGRFFEALMAQEQATYLFIEDESLGSDADRLRELVIQLGQNQERGIDAVIAVDTGGDVLHSESEEDGAQATPDQDLRVMSAIKTLADIIPQLSASIFAVGVDSPEDAHEILLRSGAWMVALSEEDIREILALYERWEINRRDDRFSKTIAVLEAVLRGKKDVFADTGLPASAMFGSRSGMVPDPYVFHGEWMRDLVFYPV